jgi:FkbM family methyltransferase
MQVNRRTTIPARLRLARWWGHQRWIPHGQDFVLRRLCPPDTAPDLGFEVDFYGLRYRGTLANFLDWTVFFYGAHSKSELTLLSHAVACLRAAERSVVYLDVGTNVGQHLLFMSARVDRAYGFEPWPPIFELAREKLALNNLGNTRVFPVALGDREARLRFYPPSTANQGTGSFVESWGADGNDRCGAPAILQVSAGDGVLEAEQIDDVGIIKIDVEGFEASVCRGLTRTFKRCRPFVLMELSAEAAREFGSEERLRSSFYQDVLMFRLVTRRHSFRLEPYRFTAEPAEVFIVPSEYGVTIERLLISELRSHKWLNSDPVRDS